MPLFWRVARATVSGVCALDHVEKVPWHCITHSHPNLLMDVKCFDRGDKQERVHESRVTRIIPNNERVVMAFVIYNLCSGFGNDPACCAFASQL